MKNWVIREINSTSVVAFELGFAGGADNSGGGLDSSGGTAGGRGNAAGDGGVEQEDGVARQQRQGRRRKRGGTPAAGGTVVDSGGVAVARGGLGNVGDSGGGCCRFASRARQVVTGGGAAMARAAARCFGGRPAPAAMARRCGRRSRCENGGSASRRKGGLAGGFGGELLPASQMGFGKTVAVSVGRAASGWGGEEDSGSDGVGQCRFAGGGATTAAAAGLTAAVARRVVEAMRRAAAASGGRTERRGKAGCASSGRRRRARGEAVTRACGRGGTPEASGTVADSGGVAVARGGSGDVGDSGGGCYRFASRARQVVTGGGAAVARAATDGAGGRPALRQQRGEGVGVARGAENGSSASRRKGRLIGGFGGEPLLGFSDLGFGKTKWRSRLVERRRVGAARRTAARWCWAAPPLPSSPPFPHIWVPEKTAGDGIDWAARRCSFF
ncbi:uncharacterized PE-PGRS family protein PE_PGRS54-like [Eucalyptus grandis]|uniref:uncharacterized PE-PGRS family protein PE_PGRS54-like n=1 Tax=Eucalyptus grandis TaxID=71139 RepID=UPI00192EA2D8|nr:uncharacterized PE-PGRS family protein PE_PGRS54-like [Eucalyptus grandis]